MAVLTYGEHKNTKTIYCGAVGISLLCNTPVFDICWQLMLNLDL